MKRRITIWSFAVVSLYGALWGLTAVCGGWLLEKQLTADLKKEWRVWRDKAENEKELWPGAKDRMAFPAGPSLKVRVISCPAPFICVAEVDRTIGGLNGRGAVGKYILTPWQTYILYEHRTWVS